MRPATLSKACALRLSTVSCHACITVPRNQRSRFPSLSRVCLGRASSGKSALSTLKPASVLVGTAAGTMFFGAATSQADAHSLLDLADARGVHCFDTAEMYPIPQSAQHQGQSEAVIGAWLQSRRREDFIIASKATGPSAQMPWIRGGPASLSRANILQALDGSLMRLKTDYIDIYQLHWPDRYVPMFGQSDFQLANAYSSVPFEEQLEALAQAVAAGKVRQVGVSNETAWGLTKLCQLGSQPGRVPVAYIQNAYSLLCRTFDSALAEVCHEEGVGLLAYSPLAMGLLTGKYLAPDGGPKEARLNKYKGRYAEAESRYGPRPNSVAAVQAYVELAQQSGMSPTALALRFVLSHPLLASVIVGAMDAEQLTELLDIAEGSRLPEDVAEAADAIHQQFPNPCP